MKRALLLVLILCFLSCKKEQKDINPINLIDFYTTNDLDFSVFNNPKYKEYYNKKYDKNIFFNHYFKVWNTTDNAITNEEWDEYFNYDLMVKKSSCFSGNYQIHTNEIINSIKSNLPIDRTTFLNQYGITTDLVNLRALPTNEFCLKNVQNAGEGYPFDYLQSSSLAIASPVHILNKTKDNLWYFVDTNNNKGWVKSDKIALVSEKQKAEIQKMDFAITTKDNQVINNGKISVKFNVGTLLPTKKGQLLIPIKNINNLLVWDTITTNNENIKPFPIEFNKENVKTTLNTLLNGKYTWGGLNGGRDCSSTLKDFYTSFGIWLPRNSSQQAKFGKQYNLIGTLKEKEQIIVNEGIPFLSTVYKKGHIMMYVGEKENNPLIFHNVWGIKAYVKDDDLSKISKLRNKFGLKGIHKVNNNEVQTRYEISRAVITSIEPAYRINNLNNFRTEIYMENMKTLTIFSE